MNTLNLFTYRCFRTGSIQFKVPVLQYRRGHSKSPVKFLSLSKVDLLPSGNLPMEIFPLKTIWIIRELPGQHKEQEMRDIEVPGRDNNRTTATVGFIVSGKHQRPSAWIMSSMAS